MWIDKRYLYLFVVIGQDDVNVYIDQIEEFVKNFYENGPGSVGENLDLGVQMLEVRFILWLLMCIMSWYKRLIRCG